MGLSGNYNWLTRLLEVIIELERLYILRKGRWYTIPVTERKKADILWVLNYRKYIKILNTTGMTIP